MSLVMTSNDVQKGYKISSYTLRSWRRGWYTKSTGMYYFFEDKSRLEHKWNPTLRRYEFNPADVKAWVERMKQKKLNK